MLDSAYPPTHPTDKRRLSVNNAHSVEAVAILEELLAQSIQLRNLYKIARWHARSRRSSEEMTRTLTDREHLP
jgi:hypothetical protein